MTLDYLAVGYPQRVAAEYGADIADQLRHYIHDALEAGASVGQYRNLRDLRPLITAGTTALMLLAIAVELDSRTDASPLAGLCRHAAELVAADAIPVTG